MDFVWFWIEIVHNSETIRMESHLSNKSNKNILKDVLSKYFYIATALSILQNIIYKSYVAFVGEIKISITTFLYNIKYPGGLI